MMRPWYRSRLFWFGVPGLVFLLWLWITSMTSARVLQFAVFSRGLWVGIVPGTIILETHQKPFIDAPSYYVQKFVALESPQWPIIDGQSFQVEKLEAEEKTLEFSAYATDTLGNPRSIFFTKEWLQPGVELDGPDVYRPLRMTGRVKIGLWLVILSYSITWLGLILWRQRYRARHLNRLHLAA